MNQHYKKGVQIRTKENSVFGHFSWGALNSELFIIILRDRQCPVLDHLIPADPLKGYDMKAVMTAVMVLIFF